MKTKRWLIRLIEVVLAACILAFVTFVVYHFFPSLGFVVYTSGLMCMIALFSVAGLLWDKKVSSKVKLAVFFLGIVLITLGILIMIWSF